MEPEFRIMVMSLEDQELRQLFHRLGTSTKGTKIELQVRALELVRTCLTVPSVLMAILDIFRFSQEIKYAKPWNPPPHPPPALHPNNDQQQQLINSRSVIIKPSQQQQLGGNQNHLKMRELPFYDYVGDVVIPPTPLLLSSAASPDVTNIPGSFQQMELKFSLTSDQANKISSSRTVVQQLTGEGCSSTNNKLTSKIYYGTQLILRFCEYYREEEEKGNNSKTNLPDKFPPGQLSVKLNGKEVILPPLFPSCQPGGEPKRHPKPIFATYFAKLSPLVSNILIIQWQPSSSHLLSKKSDYDQIYCVSAYVATQLKATDLFNRLTLKQIQPLTTTLQKIRELMVMDEEDKDCCGVSSLRVSVNCPLGKTRMNYPCRSVACNHLQCFDANLFLMMNEKRPIFNCPVCSEHLKFGDLVIDGFFMNVIKTLTNNRLLDDVEIIEVGAGGKWIPVMKKGGNNASSKRRRSSDEDHDDSSNSGGEETLRRWRKIETSSLRDDDRIGLNKKHKVIDLESSSSEKEEADVDDDVRESQQEQYQYHDNNTIEVVTID